MAITFLFLLVLVNHLYSTEAETSSPWVEVYSKTIGSYDRPNTLICHVKDFYPPEIKVELLKDGVVIPDVKQSEMAFTEKWLYHVTRYKDFTPQKGEKYSCRVTHNNVENTYIWEPDV